ncbi:30S ribosomal protein S2 [Candidatus Tisiphia endosymbiont of Nemotelus uliginosus]|uniref:30S ribosomal protein S2 n=1 Tax=Candidatus Tisiphia endosymbiont of Nemotelus uliginosus TaxID=3077926 RepID=UPI0035C88A5A
MSKVQTVNIKELLDAGVHFGHKTSRWNPKMAPYIYGSRDDIHVIDLQQTVALMQRALNVMCETVKKNGKILFVSTKVQASEIIAEYAEKCGQYYVNHRWLGGMLTNWGTISNSIKKLDKLEKVLANEEEYSGYTKKEILEMTRKKDKLLRSLGGIRHIDTKPNLLVIIDTNKEHLAIQEAVKLRIPIIAIVDTNSNPDNIDYPIPGNDDAIRSIKLYCNLFADAILAGIEESLVASGVDLGSIENQEEKNKNIRNIAKLNFSKKFSKMPETGSEAATEFERVLEQSEEEQTTKKPKKQY